MDDNALHSVSDEDSNMVLSFLDLHEVNEDAKLSYGSTGTRDPIESLKALNRRSDSKVKKSPSPQLLGQSLMHGTTSIAASYGICIS